MLNFGLQSKSLNSELISEAYNLRLNYKRPSMNDLFALVLAKHEECPLLTGDRALRELTQKMNIEVHGTIWLVKQMLQHQKISVDVAQIAFCRMKEAGSRLPWEEVRVLLQVDELHISNCT